MVPNFWQSVWTSVKVKTKNLLIFLLKSTPCWLTFPKLHHWGHTNKHTQRKKNIITISSGGCVNPHAPVYNLMVKSDLLKTIQISIQFFLNKKFKNGFYFFTCILPVISKEFWKNSHFKKNDSWFSSEISKFISVKYPWNDAFWGIEIFYFHQYCPSNSYCSHQM
jgi:hypothetical protein